MGIELHLLKELKLIQPLGEHEYNAIELRSSQALERNSYNGAANWLEQNTHLSKLHQTNKASLTYDQSFISKIVATVASHIANDIGTELNQSYIDEIASVTKENLATPYLLLNAVPQNYLNYFASISYKPFDYRPNIASLSGDQRFIFDLYSSILKTPEKFGFDSNDDTSIFRCTSYESSDSKHFSFFSLKQYNSPWTFSTSSANMLNSLFSDLTFNNNNPVVSATQQEMEEAQQEEPAQVFYTPDIDIRDYQPLQEERETYNVTGLFLKNCLASPNDQIAINFAKQAADQMVTVHPLAELFFAYHAINAEEKDFPTVFIGSSYSLGKLVGGLSTQDKNFIKQKDQIEQLFGEPISISLIFHETIHSAVKFLNGLRGNDYWSKPIANEKQQEEYLNAMCDVLTNLLVAAEQDGVQNCSIKMVFDSATKMLHSNDIIPQSIETLDDARDIALKYKSMIQFLPLNAEQESFIGEVSNAINGILKLRGFEEQVQGDSKEALFDFALDVLNETNPELTTFFENIFSKYGGFAMTINTLYNLSFKTDLVRASGFTHKIYNLDSVQPEFITHVLEDIIDNPGQDYMNNISPLTDYVCRNMVPEMVEYIESSELYTTGQLQYNKADIEEFCS